MAAVPHSACGLKLLLAPAGGGSILYHGVTGETYAIEGDAVLNYNDGWAYVTVGEVSRWVSGGDPMFDKLLCQDGQQQYVASASGAFEPYMLPLDGHHSAFGYLPLQLETDDTPVARSVKIWNLTPTRSGCRFFYNVRDFQDRGRQQINDCMIKIMA
eukprot:6293977-Lingulodinium_polyedra.AAC.2